MIIMMSVTPPGKLLVAMSMRWIQSKVCSHRMLLVYEQIRPSRVITEGAFSNGLHVRVDSSEERRNGWKHDTIPQRCLLLFWRFATRLYDVNTT